MSAATLKALFAELVQHAHGLLQGTELLLSNFDGEVSDFVRFNHGLVRQAMTVRQARLELTLIDGRRRRSLSLGLSGSPALDKPRVAEALASLRSVLPRLPEDPYLLYATEATQSSRETPGQLPGADAAIADIVAAAQGTDLVGLLASGPVLRGFASSLGAFHWHAVEAFLFDYSLYLHGDKAVKRAWSGSRWDGAELRQGIEQAHTELAHLAKPARSLEPGHYRAYLAPAAMEDLVGMLNWDGISAKAQRTRQSCIQQLADGVASFSPLVSLGEDTARGLAPAFDPCGFTKPAYVPLVHQGRHAGSMVSPRTGAEYGLPANGAGEHEDAASLSLAGGSLAEADALAALDKGLAIANLHYLNFSDRQGARVTGMTRFATFWVEGGRIVAPVNVMRWDDTLYSLLGDALEALTDTPQWLLSSDTYEQRSVKTSRVPGALLGRMAFTL